MDRFRNVLLLSETALVAWSLAVAVLRLDAMTGPWARAGVVLCVLALGAWLHRIYVVGHEAVHRKLFDWRPANEVIGQLVLTPLLVPLQVYRKIHRFHHGHNRRDIHTSALDTFVVRGDADGNVRTWERAKAWTLWVLAVFGGGFFVHSLVSVVLFLALPLRVARKVSPAFNGWTRGDQLLSIAQFGLGVGVHVLAARTLGAHGYALVLGWPLLAFAFIYSVLVYIYHYGTTYGAPVKYNARSLKRHPLLAWWLLNFNEHATHHQKPDLPWYELPGRRMPLPKEYRDANQNVTTVFEAILQLLEGPNIVVERERSEP